MTKRVLTSGYISLDHIVKIKSPARVGFTSIIENKTCGDIQFGGCSVNIAYALARLGLPATPILRVGSDYESTGLRAFLEAGGVDTSAVTSVPEERTSQCYLVQDNEGQHITLYYPGSMAGVYAKPLPDAHFAGAALGVMTVGARCELSLLARSSWLAGHVLVAGRLREGRAFLAGDAAHLFTLTGGLGYNTGVEDAVNLGWKLAAVLREGAPASLLDSYEAERRPAAIRNTGYARGFADSIGLFVPPGEIGRAHV